MQATVAVPTRGSAFCWPSNNYWTGELNDPNNARIVNLDNGNDNNDNVNNPNSVVCRR